jgi:hypothetical protein
MYVCNTETCAKLHQHLEWIAEVVPRLLFYDSYHKEHRNFDRHTLVYALAKKIGKLWLAVGYVWKWYLNVFYSIMYRLGPRAYLLA